MKNGKIALSVIVVFAVLTVFVVSTVSAPPLANTVYFIPQHSTISGGPCNNTTVELRVNTTDAINSWNTFVSFNPACVNITNVTYAWTPGAPWTHHGNYVDIGDAKMLPCVAGDMHLATLTIHCEAWGCMSPLNFSGIDNITRQISCAGTYFATAWQNGTVTNEAAVVPPYLVTYTISNRTITPPQTTSIDVEFLETVSYKIAIEKNSATIYDWGGTDKNPTAKVRNGTYEANGTVVPVGDYTVNITGTNTTTGLSVINNTEIITVAMPDLNVSSIIVNPGDTRGEDISRAYINESNNISAVVCNNGAADAGAFDVCFAVRNSTTTYKIGCKEVASLAAGANTTVYVEWTPTCENFSSVMSTFPYTSQPFWINATADCNCTNCPTCPADGSKGKINESDETNNTLSKFIPAIQIYSGTNGLIGGVVNNGYKSKNFDCNTTEEPLYQFEYDDMYGGIAYNVSGVKISNFAPGNTSTRVHHIDIPDGRTVKKARLYVYWYDKWDNYKTYPSGCLANLSVNFSGMEFMPDAKYTDAKGFEKYQNPKGTYAYNVTSKVAGSGDYIAVVKNIDPNNSTTLLGEMLYVVYEDPTGNNPIQLWTLEGNDYLMAADDTHNPSYDFSVSPEEATATVAFSGPIDLANVTSTTLVSVVAQGMSTGINMLFNGSIIKTDAWNSPTEAYPGSKINVESIDVQTNLLSSGNNMGFQDNGTGGMQASNAMLLLKFGEPDLNVSSISINPGDTRAEEIVRIYVNESNNISAVVRNNGTADAGAFDVCFDVDGVMIGCDAIAGLAAGANTTVSIDWTPTCTNFSSVMPSFPYTSEAFWINVTADCNCTDCPTCPDDGSNGKITESDETNNTLAKYVPAIQTYPGTNGLIGGVVNNGYKSKIFDCDITEEPLYQFEYDGEIIGGGIVYNVSGEKISTFSPSNTSTRIHHIDLPGNATVKKARLYVYWYDKWDNYKTYPTGCLANLSVTMDGTEFMPEVKYNDAKGFEKYQNPKGTYAYDITSKVTASGDYTAIVENIDPANSTTLLGQLLFVQYEDTTKTNRVQKWILEGNDYLMAADDTHNPSYDFSVSPEEATATVAFPGSVDLARVTNATLVSVVAQGMAPGSNMLFNGGVIKTDAWNSPTEAYPNSKINVESVDVKSYLLSSGNNMGFQDNGTGGMQASNAFLVITYEEEEEEFFDTGLPANPYPSIMGTHNGTITPCQTINVSKMYTYPCTGTGGHSEYAAFYNATTGEEIANGTWDGYQGAGDYHYIEFDVPFVLHANEIYNYTIRTGSYPQIIHEESKDVTGGTITCTKFVDANGKEYNNWILAIRFGE